MYSLLNYQFSQHSSCTLFSTSWENWGQDTWGLKWLFQLFVLSQQCYPKLPSLKSSFCLCKFSLLWHRTWFAQSWKVLGFQKNLKNHEVNLTQIILSYFGGIVSFSGMECHHKSWPSGESGQRKLMCKYIRPAVWHKHACSCTQLVELKHKHRSAFDFGCSWKSNFILESLKKKLVFLYEPCRGFI